jgi:hypothetical protein
MSAELSHFTLMLTRHAISERLDFFPPFNTQAGGIRDEKSNATLFRTYFSVAHWRNS